MADLVTLSTRSPSTTPADVAHAGYLAAAHAELAAEVVHIGEPREDDAGGWALELESAALAGGPLGWAGGGARLHWRPDGRAPGWWLTILARNGRPARGWPRRLTGDLGDPRPLPVHADPAELAYVVARVLDKGH